MCTIVGIDGHAMAVVAINVWVLEGLGGIGRWIEACLDPLMTSIRTVSGDDTRACGIRLHIESIGSRVYIVGAYLIADIDVMVWRRVERKHVRQDISIQALRIRNRRWSHLGHGRCSSGLASDDGTWQESGHSRGQSRWTSGGLGCRDLTGTGGWYSSWSY